jgi:shikimate kinase
MQLRMPKKKNIYLSGFMASGKSTVGRMLARRLDYHYVDVDREIVAQTGMTIEKIFSRYGEAYFRHLESKLLARLARSKKNVVSLGGGAVLAATNRQLFKSGHWIYLDVPFSVLQRRLNNNPRGRPLARKGTDLILDLYRRRQFLYHQAPYIIRCGTERPDFICQKILNRIK